MLASWLRRVWRHLPACLQLVAVNQTDDNFTDIEIEVRIPGEVATWTQDLAAVGVGGGAMFPTRPDVLGTPKVLPSVTISSSYGAVGSITSGAVEARRVDLAGLPVAKGAGPVTVIYSKIDLRPQQRKLLPVRRLIVDVAEGGLLDCAWSATARNASGVNTGAFMLTVAPSSLDLASKSDTSQGRHW